MDLGRDLGRTAAATHAAIAHTEQVQVSPHGFNYV